jgi:hypothetical protein
MRFSFELGVPEHLVTLDGATNINLRAALYRRHQRRTPRTRRRPTTGVASALAVKVVNPEFPF